MGTELKNGKHHTFNIYAALLILLFIVPCNIKTFSAGPKSNGKWVIVIDPGHGGSDPGSLGSVTRESDINLAISLKTGRMIEENLKNVKVIFTRENDTFVDLYERPKIANRADADLFISIHSNWWHNRLPAGSETYIMGPTKDSANLAVAMKENEVMLLENDYSTKYQGFDPKSPESYIMFTIMQNVFQKQSTDIASRVQNELVQNLKRTDRGVKQAGFWVLYNTKMPSILIETGFLTNPADEKYLNSAAGQDNIASAIFRACRDYINDIDLRSGISVDKKADSVRSLKSTGQLIFSVQVATSAEKKEIKPENFRGIKDIYEINLEDRFKYVSGNFEEYSDAVKYRKKIEAVYPDAFVIAVKDNKILPLQQALEQKKKKNR